MSYIQAMQTQPNKVTQILLTAVGLFLLVLAMTLNHYHPRNEGVSTVTHNNIYRLQLDIAQTPLVGFGAPALASDVARVYNPPQVGQPPQSIPVAATDKNAPKPDADNTADSLPNPEACLQIDDQQIALTQKNYDKSYREYVDLKTKNDNDHKSNPDSSDNKQTYYQTYLNALDSDYAAYQLAVLNKGCQPSQPAPTAQES